MIMMIMIMIDYKIPLFYFILKEDLLIDLIVCLVISFSTCLQ
jgi:hypothetical protein